MMQLNLQKNCLKNDRFLSVDFNPEKWVGTRPGIIWLGNKKVVSQ